MSFVSLGGKYAGVLTKQLKNGSTAFYIKYRDFDSKSKRKKVGVSPDMTKAKALQKLFEIKEEIRAKKELLKNPNSPIPTILKKKTDKTVYTLNELAGYYFLENKNKKTNRSQQNKYKYHFYNEPFAQKNINLITEEDIEDFLERKKMQRADNRRSTSDTNIDLEDREEKEYETNNYHICKLEEAIEKYDNIDDAWREQNKIKYLRERNRILGYRLFPEEAKKLDRDNSLSEDQKRRLKGLMSKKTIKELLLLASTIINFANRHKKLNIANQFNIVKGDRLYISVSNVKPRFLKKEEIKAYLKEIKHITETETEQHNYLYLISLLALSTAARRTTILNIKIEDIDLENNIINLRNYKTEHYFTSTISNPAIKEEIIRVINGRPASSFLFENPTTGMAITGFPPKMKEVLDYTVNCHKSYLNHLTIKEFRNTVASHLAMSGTSLAHIAQVLDHASIRTTEIYAHLMPTTAKEDLAAFVSDYLKEEGD